jgi:hypothetical protein
VNQFTRILPALNFTADSCNIAFCKDRREVMLHITDASGAQFSVAIPDALMATITGEFIKVRLFGLH